MEVQRSSIGDITYRGHTFKNITSQLKRDDIPNCDTYTPTTSEEKADYMLSTEDSDLWVPGSPEKLRLKVSREFYRANGAYGSNTAMTAAAQEINQERDETISKFLDGDMSQEELTDTFERLLNQFRSACDENDYPTPLGLTFHEDEGMAAAFYGDFRAQILKQAVQRNDEEGKQYITGEIDTQRNWKYYNSDYYFKSEDALAALDKGLEQFLDHVGIKDYKVDIPDYKAEGLDDRYNFSSAWSAYQGMCSWYGEADQFMKDYDAVPPKGFEWFYQSGGDASQKVFYVEAGVVPTHVPFDPKDASSATTWAAYRDSNGKRHFISKDFAYDYSENDLKVVSSLLKFTENKEEDSPFNRFLDSLQVCKKGHYRRFDLTRTLELWA
ncbi:MAG: hypothetical protein K2N78_04550 [Oscillospiraceae bacterium]|nr:hypothetical protein [Oscillospiraceae bacterium]